MSRAKSIPRRTIPRLAPRLDNLPDGKTTKWCAIGSCRWRTRIPSGSGRMCGRDGSGSVKAFDVQFFRAPGWR